MEKYKTNCLGFGLMHNDIKAIDFVQSFGKLQLRPLNGGLWGVKTSVGSNPCSIVNLILYLRLYLYLYLSTYEYKRHSRAISLGKDITWVGPRQPTIVNFG